MKRNLISIFTLSLAIAGCGSDGASNPLEGRFIDDPVRGLTYTCTGGGKSDNTGKTSATGGFSYFDGQTCTFKIGKVTLGPAVKVGTDSVITPQDVAGVSRAATDAPSALAIAQFLQSFNDGSASGSLVIPDDVHTKLENVTAVSLVSSTRTVSSDELTALVANVPGKTLVSAATAKAQLVKQIDAGVVDTKKGSADTTVVTLNSIEVTSDVSSNAAGLTETFTAYGYWSDGRPKEKLTTGVTWSSSDTSVVSLADNVGTGKAVGKSTITASYTPSGSSTAISGSMTQATLEASITNLAISFVKAAVSSITYGASEAIQAIATYSDKTTKTVSSAVTWLVSAATGSSGAGTVSSSGDATSLKADKLGFVDIAAQYLGLTSNKVNVEITNTNGITPAAAITTVNAN